jgi:uncharacterized protein YigA (DUF484 family)
MTIRRDDLHAMHPITEDDIADYLSNTPGFFERHAQLLAQVELTSPHGHRAVSLQERQAQMLREKIKALEHRVVDMVRQGNENSVTADRLHEWARGLLAQRDPRGLPIQIAAELGSLFKVAQTAIKVWDVDRAYAREPYAKGASDKARAFAAALARPVCGTDADAEALGWLDEPRAAASVALLPLRPAPDAPAFGLLVLASPDAQRFNAETGTHFLERIAELASAALARLRS